MTNSIISLMLIILWLMLMFISPLFKGKDYLVALCITTSMICIISAIIVSVFNS